MLHGRRARFSPPVQLAVLVALALLGAWVCWVLVQGIMEPDKVSPVKAWIAGLAFSWAAEPFGVLIAHLLSRKSDT